MAGCACNSADDAGVLCPVIWVRIHYALVVRQPSRHQSRIAQHADPDHNIDSSVEEVDDLVGDDGVDVNVGILHS